MFEQMSLAARLGLLVSAAPMVLAVAFAIRPGERLLSLMRPLTLAAVFAAVCNLLLGSVNALRALARTEGGTPRPSGSGRRCSPRRSPRRSSGVPA